MPHRKAAIKRLRVDKKRHERNLRIRIDLKKRIKKFQALIAGQKLPEAKEALIGLISKLDKAVSKKILHKNAVSHKKSQLMKILSSISKKPVGTR